MARGVYSNWNEDMTALTEPQSRTVNRAHGSSTAGTLSVGTGQNLPLHHYQEEEPKRSYRAPIRNIRVLDSFLQNPHSAAPRGPITAQFELDELVELGLQIEICPPSGTFRLVRGISTTRDRKVER